MEEQATTSQQRHGKVQWPGPIVQKTAEQGEDKRMRDTPINITEKKNVRELVEPYLLDRMGINW